MKHVSPPSPAPSSILVSPLYVAAQLEVVFSNMYCYVCMLWMYCCDRSAECWVTPNVCHPPPTEVSPTEQNRSNVCPIWRLSHYLLHLHITNSCAICKPVQLLSSQMWMLIWLFLCMWTWEHNVLKVCVQNVWDVVKVKWRNMCVTFSTEAGGLQSGPMQSLLSKI